MRNYGTGKLLFDKYKDRLIDYFNMQGVQVRLGEVGKCPWHEDSTPSFSVFKGDDGTPAFNCFGCGRAGDIYKAVEFFTGESSPKKQFEEIDRIFGAGLGSSLSKLPPPKPAEPQEPEFKADPAALQKFTEWLKSQPKASEYILGYFSQRAQAKSSGQIFQYPKDILRRLVTFFYWYPGKQAAEAALGKETLFAAGVPYAKRDEALPLAQRNIAWWHPGVLAKSPEGFKLLFMDGIESKKINPRSGVSYFPIPGELPQEKPVVLLEGEIDAIVCQAAGIDNAYSMGGKGGLTKARIEKYIIPKNIPEIILFADADKDGGSQKKFGLMPITAADHIRETVPENLIKMGYKGKIKVTVLPDDCGFKDPDDAIRNGRFDLVKAAIQNAKDYAAPPHEMPSRAAANVQSGATPSGMPFEKLYSEWEDIPLKFFRSFIKKIKYEDLTSEEAADFIQAAALGCKEISEVPDLEVWTGGEFTQGQVREAAKNKDGGANPFALITIAARHGVSDYILKRLEEILVPATELLRMIDPIPTILPIDYEKMADSKDFQSFLHFCDNAFAAYVLAKALKGNMLYIDTEEANFVFNGNYWVRVPSIATEAHAALTNALLVYLRKNPRDKKIVLDCIKTIGSNSFRQKLSNDLNKKQGYFYHDEKTAPILFDSHPVRETLTLLDGVLDFSGDKIKFRRGLPEEYRLIPLPYTCKQIRQAMPPEFFLKALDLDFNKPSEETLKKNPTLTKDTLLYYLSLIPSRNCSKNYSCFMTGPGGTGKSTIISAIQKIFSNENIAQLKSTVLIAKKKSFDNENGPSPEIAELEGKLASITMELPEDGRLNTDVLKRLTGNDLISARQLRQSLHKFLPTAQIIIVGNELPSFYKHDSGIIRRLLVFHFNVEHAKRAKEKEFKAIYKNLPSNSSDMSKRIAEEAPGILKLLCEKYIELKQKFDLNIPISQECENAKSQYIEDQNKDTDRFYEACVRFTPSDDKAFVFSRQLYKCYLNFNGYQEGSSEALKQRNFIFYLKKDHPELGGQNYCQRRPDSNSIPEWGFKFISFTEEGLEYLNKTDAQQELPQQNTEPPKDNPFAPPPPPSNLDPLTDDDGNDIDIY